MNTLKMAQHNGNFLKLSVLWMAILLLGSFLLSAMGNSDEVMMTVLPESPRENEPVMVTFKLNNPSPEPSLISYEFFANGELIREGNAMIAPSSSKVYKYVYENELPLGSQLNFLVRTDSNQGKYQKLLSTPPYPPQLWSSFVSFASFSTSVMTSMATMSFYRDSFTNVGLNVGIFTSLVLIALLIFMEMPIAAIQKQKTAVLGKLRIRFGTLIWILLIIFMSMIYTQLILIVSG